MWSYLLSTQGEKLKICYSHRHIRFVQNSSFNTRHSRRKSENLSDIKLLSDKMLSRPLVGRPSDKTESLPVPAMDIDDTFPARDPPDEILRGVPRGIGVVSGTRGVSIHSSSSKTASDWLQWRPKREEGPYWEGEDGVRGGLEGSSWPCIPKHVVTQWKIKLFNYDIVFFYFWF